MHSKTRIESGKVFVKVKCNNGLIYDLNITDGMSTLLTYIVPEKKPEPVKLETKNTDSYKTVLKDLKTTSDDMLSLLDKIPESQKEKTQTKNTDSYKTALKDFKETPIPKINEPTPKGSILQVWEVQEKQKENKKTRKNEIDDYVYENYGDLYMGRALFPVKLRNHIMLGSHYLVHCIKFIRKNEEQSLQLYSRNLLTQITEIEKSFTNIKDLIFEIELQTPSMSDEEIKGVIHPIINRLKSWPKKINKKPASLAVHLFCDISLYETSNFNENMKALIKTFHDICSSGVDILWLSLECLPDGYFSALEKCNFRKALEIFFGYYEKCALFMYAFFSLYDSKKHIIGVKSPSWMIPSFLESNIAEIYRPLVVPIGSKLIALPALCQKTTILTFSEGSGALAKAMTGMPLMVPSIVEMSNGNIALSLADIVSTQMVYNPDNLMDFTKIQGTQSTINYYNCRHEKEGFLANRETTHFLMKTISRTPALYLFITFPNIFEMAKKLLKCPTVEVYFNIVNEVVDEILCTKDDHKDFNLSENEITILKAVKS